MENVTDISDGALPLCSQKGTFHETVFMLHVLTFLQVLI